MRAALQQLAWDANVGVPRVVNRLFGATAWVDWHATGFRLVARMPIGPPVVGPLPDIADHVEQAVAVRREGAHGGGPLEPVRGEIFDWKPSLPGVRHRLSIGVEFITPGEFR